MSGKTTNTECRCAQCIRSCSNSCGWFGSIEEVVGAAKIMRMPLSDFVTEYLIREWYYAETIEIPAPRKNFERSNLNYKQRGGWLDEMKNNGRGFVRASWSHNLMTGYACIFLTDDNLCLIHESKPCECKVTFGCGESNKTIRREIEAYWKDNQEWVMSFVGGNK